MKILLTLFIMLFGIQVRATPAPMTWAADATTGAAMGYCLAKHPYRTIQSGSYTADGFEIVASPGIVGAVRRNFVFDRTLPNDEGSKNNCTKACAEFGKFYGTSLKGFPLKQKVASGTPVPLLINSGIGDVASLAVLDNDYYNGNKVTAGILSRGNTFQESDVAQSDYCCCQVK